MLERLLDLIAGGGAFSPAEIGVKLGVSETLVVQMLEDLARKGYLRKVVACAPDACRVCSQGESCTPAKPRVWVRVK